ncbi:MAG: hypothetical protein ABI323_12965 [Solirubrobacteraceae bacterium]
MTGDCHARICGSRGLRRSRPPDYHSIIQRKVLDPNDFQDTAALAKALDDFADRYNQIAEPFVWNFTRAKLAALLKRLKHAPDDSNTPPTSHQSRSPPDRDGTYGGEH